MKKQLLQKFIDKYNLNGIANAVIIKSDFQTGTSVDFISEDRNVIGYITSEEVLLPDGSYPVYDTPQLKSLLNVLDDDITIQFKSKKIILEDSHTEVNFVLSAPNNIPVAPTLKKIPVFEITTHLSKNIIDKYIKSFASLKDAKVFTVLSDGIDLSVCLGYSRNNTNRVNLKIDTFSNISQISPIHFSAPYLREILSVNKEAKNVLLEVSSAGLAKLSFDIEKYKITYYLPQITLQD